MFENLYRMRRRKAQPRDERAVMHVRPMVMSIGIVNGRSTILMNVNGVYMRLPTDANSFSRLAAAGVLVENCTAPNGI